LTTRQEWFAGSLVRGGREVIRLANHLFLRPRYEHYYFGDYYAAGYRGRGYYPWFSVNAGHYGYDPIYAHERWQHRADSEWERRQQADFDNRRDHEDARPPHTLAGQGLQDASDATARAGLPRIAAFLGNLGARRENAAQFQQIDAAEQQRLAQQAQDVQRFREQRQRQEAESGVPAGMPTREFTPTRAPLPGSPIVVKPGVNIDRDHTPPKNLEAPQTDTSVVPKPRTARSADQPPPQPEVDRPALQPRSNAAGAKEDKPKDKDK
jgi:hypothetical protein